MGALTRELDDIQNPALGAMLSWRFVAGFDNGSPIGAGSPLPYAFLPLPMLMHEEPASLLLETRTRSGIRKFTEKFMSSKESKSDLLLVLNRRMTQQAQGRLQVIVLDHAPETVWQGIAGVQLTEDWRDGRKLAPTEWIG